MFLRLYDVYKKKEKKYGTNTEKLSYKVYTLFFIADFIIT